MMSFSFDPKGDIMSKLGSYGKGLFNSILSFHYLLPVTAVVLILILGAALYNVSEESGYMREQLRSDFNQQQLILARQAAAQIDADLRDIEVELATLAQHHPESDGIETSTGVAQCEEDDDYDGDDQEADDGAALGKERERRPGVEDELEVQPAFDDDG